MLSAPVAPASAAGFVDWDNASVLSNSVTSYTATGDGFFMASGINNAGWECSVTTAAGTVRTYVAKSDNDDDFDDVIVPLAKGDKLTITPCGGASGFNGAYFVPASGGISVDDLKEELKKGTFENIKTQTLETTGNATVDGNLTVKGNTQLGDSTADTTGISGNATVGKDLSVAGNETVEGNEVIRNFT